MNIKNTTIYQAVRKVYYLVKNGDETLDNIKIWGSMRPFKGKHKGQACVIIGNGPSLKIEDLERLYELNIPTFGCNRVNLAFPKTNWRPTYYFMSDEKLIAQYDNDVEGVPEKHRFFPKRYRAQNVAGRFYNELEFDYRVEGKFSENAAKGVYPGGSITTEMMQIAYYMGFQEIYLIGVDFSYAHNSPLNNSTYEYQGENNYFIENYLKPGEIAAIPNIEANLLAFHAAKDTIEAAGRIVGNATRGGKLEVFRRYNLDDLFEKWEDKNR